MLAIILLTIVFILIFFALHKLRFKGRNILRIILIVLVLEIYVFNINSLRLVGRNYEEKTYTVDQLSIKNMKYDEDKDCYVIEKKSNPSIDVKNIGTEVANIKIDAELVGTTKTLNYYVSYTDETSENYRNLPTKTIVNNIERSKYTTCYLSGNSKKLRIHFSGDQNAKIKINSITINGKAPFYFSLPRFLTLSIIFLLIYLKNLTHQKIKDNY